MSNVAGIFVQGHILILTNICIPVLLVTLLIVGSSYNAYIWSRLSYIWTGERLYGCQ